MHAERIIVEAIFEDGILRPLQPLPLAAQQRVRLTIQVRTARAWPEDVATIYQEIAEEDLRLAQAMCGHVKPGGSHA
jgi:predicted DNA-binding antitoxin AbrB/MazE fold protein